MLIEIVRLEDDNDDKNATGLYPSSRTQPRDAISTR